jgi:hypothetical protein
MFNGSNAKENGRKGGKAKTAIKRKTARMNGKKGGRPRSQTLAEWLLGRTVAPQQYKYIKEAYDDLFVGEHQVLEKYFQTFGLKDPLNTTDWEAQSRRVPPDVSYIIERFKVAAKHHLKEVPTPKPFVVEYEPPEPWQRVEWERVHRGLSIPCPPRKVSVDVRRLTDFSFLEFIYERDGELTVETIMEACGSQWTEKRAQVVLDWIKYTHSTEHGRPK